MRNRFYIAIMLILIPLAVFAQASGGQIRRHSHTQQTEHGNVNRQRTANHYNRDNAQPKRSLPTGKVNGYDAIDLGLSVRWATCNIGASSPEDFGSFYAYGDPTGKKFTHNIHDYPGGKNIVNTELDIAKKHWGIEWRLPTTEEMKELKEKCTWKYSELNGVKGYYAIGPNGCSIFLPIAGCTPNGEERYSVDVGYYMCGDNSNEYYSFPLNLYSHAPSIGPNYLYFGISVRAVTN